MQERKRAERYTKRLETEFSAAGKTHKGFLSNLSRTGLFIRTRRSFESGSEIDIKIYLPDGKESYISGIVRRAITSDEGLLARNGMGVELTKIDINYENLMKQVQRKNVLMILCPSCGAKNEVPGDKLSPGAKCGSCKAPLPTEGDDDKDDKKEPKEAEVLLIKCPGCGVKNKVPGDKLSLGPKCGICKEPLPTE